MASPGPEQPAIAGRVDSRGNLIAADAALERLQVEAGSALGRPLALPQLAALAKAASSLRLPLSRALVAADARHDLDLFVRAEPDGDEVTLTIERWAERPAAGPRLALVPPMSDVPTQPDASLYFRTDSSLTITQVSPALAELAGKDAAQCVGAQLTALFRLVEGEAGAMPLLSAVAERSRVEGQRATVRGAPDRELVIDAELLVDSRGQFDGLSGSIRSDVERSGPSGAIEESLDQALRSPLDRIIEAADRIVERGEGPLRSDYASYAGDIAAAGRHLLSVIRGLGAQGGSGASAASAVDLAALAEEAVALVQPIARERDMRIDVSRPECACLAKGEKRAIVQILVNIIGNALRHSPRGTSVGLSFGRDEVAGRCSVTVTDNGPGIGASDQQRIFERYEQAGNPADGTGLGLAISRRLAQSLGGDIALVSRLGEGAAFTLTLPSA